MEHDPLRCGGDALVALIQRRQLGEHGIIRVGHGEGLREGFGTRNIVEILGLLMVEGVCCLLYGCSLGFQVCCIPLRKLMQGIDYESR